MKPIFLSQIALGELYKVEALRVGEWEHPEVDGGKFKITPKHLSEMVENFRAGAKGWELELNVDHDRPCGWVKDVKLSDDGCSLFALFEITEPDVQQSVDNGTIKFASSEIDLHWRDPEEGREKIVFEGLALTNRPYIKRMEPVKRATVNLSEPFLTGLPKGKNNGGKVKTDEATLSLSEQLAQKDQLIADLTARVELAEKRHRGDSIKEQVEAAHLRLSEHFRSGKLTVPAYTGFRTLFERLIRSGHSTVKLAEGEPIDKLDIIREVSDLLGELPDAMSVDSPNLQLEDPAAAAATVPTEDDLLAQANQFQQEDPNLSRPAAVSLAAKRLGIKTLTEVKR